MLKTFLPYISKYKWSSLLASLTVVIEVIFEILIPFLMSRIIDTAVPDHDMDAIYRTGGAMIWMAVLSLVFGVLSGVFAARGGIGFGAELRKGLFDKIQTYSFKNIDDFSAPALITRLTTDITNVQMAYMMIIRVLVRSPVMLISAIVMAVALNGELVKLFIISIPILAVAFVILMWVAFPKFKLMLSRVDDLNGVVKENLIGIRTVKAFNRQDYEKEKFGEANSNLTKALLSAQNILITIFPVMMLVMNGTILAIVWFGGRQIIRGVFLTGELISFISYCTQILMSLMMIGQIIMMITISFTSLSRIREALDEKVNITDEDANPSLKVKDGSIEFKDVDFKYNPTAELNTLSDVNLKIKSGETIGILGGTGSSKSTLVQLIPRLYDVTTGEVLVSGHNVKDYTLEELRDSVAVVLQTNTLFSGTIAENLRWGNADATDEQLLQACRDASIDDFVEALPDGLETYLEEGGTNLSGGQKQRLCIARALLKHPKIIILDDSTSAVDMATDQKIRTSFKKNLKGMTTIIIAQRIASVEEADRIIIMDEGRVEAFDTPANLEKTNMIYRAIMESQQREVGSLIENYLDGINDSIGAGTDATRVEEFYENDIPYTKADEMDEYEYAEQKADLVEKQIEDTYREEEA